MTENFRDALAELKAVGGKHGVSPAEKDLVRHLASALQEIDRRLSALENGSPSAPISDTPQGETAPLSR